MGYVSSLEGSSWSLNFLSQPFFRIPIFLTNLPAMMTHSDWWITSVNPCFWWFEIQFRCHGGTSSDYWSGGVVGWWWLSTTRFLLSFPGSLVDQTFRANGPERMTQENQGFPTTKVQSLVDLVFLGLDMWKWTLLWITCFQTFKSCSTKLHTSILSLCLLYQVLRLRHTTLMRFPNPAVARQK